MVSMDLCSLWAPLRSVGDLRDASFAERRRT